MKSISIRTMYGPIDLIDNSDRTKEEIINDLSVLTKLSTNVIVHVEDTSVLIRPSTVFGIIVKDNNGDNETPTSEKPEIDIKELEQTIETPNEDIDIITDVE